MHSFQHIQVVRGHVGTRRWVHVHSCLRVAALSMQAKLLRLKVRVKGIIDCLYGLLDDIPKVGAAP